MMLEEFKTFIDKLKESNSRLHKEAVLKEYADNDNVKEIRRFNYCL